MTWTNWDTEDDIPNGGDSENWAHMSARRNYRWNDCPDDYRQSYRVICIDVDECSLPEKNNCHSESTCTNTSGSFTCVCNTGYDGDGVNCTDIDECSIPEESNCDAMSTCTNTNGSYECHCNPGWESVNDGQSDTVCDEIRDVDVSFPQKSGLPEVQQTYNIENLAEFTQFSYFEQENFPQLNIDLVVPGKMHHCSLI